MLLFTMQHIVNRPGPCCNPSFQFLTKILNHQLPEGAPAMALMPNHLRRGLLDFQIPQVLPAIVHVFTPG